MQILQIVPSISLVYGGPSQMVLGLSKALAKQNIRVTILTTNSNGDSGQIPLDVPLGQIIKQDGYEIIYYPCSPFRRYKFSLDLLNWLTTHANKYDLAHIHALFSPVSTSAATIARWKNLPYILRPLGTLDPADLQKKKYLKKIYGLLWEKPNLAGASAIHFTSEEEAKISERFGTNPQDLILPLGVDLDKNNLPELGKLRQQLGIDPEQTLLLFMSRLDRKKGLDLLIPALEKLLQQGANFHFVLAGNNPQDPDYEKQIQQQIKNSILDKHCTIVGFVTGETKLGLLQDADLFILPSYYENFGIAVAEAMAMGKAVVISDGVHIWSEIKQANAGWISSCDVDKLTEVLQTAISDRNSSKERGLNGKKLVAEKYSWEAIAIKMIETYQKIIN